jgi:hypothetical protein
VKQTSGIDHSVDLSSFALLQGESQRVAKVARLPHGEETKAQEEGTPDMPTANVEDEGDEGDAPVATNAKSIIELISNLWSDDRSVNEEALLDLADLCQEEDTDLSQANEREICRLGGHMAVVQVVKKHEDEVRIQEEGIRALHTLTSHHQRARVFVGDVSGLEVIPAAMKRHPEVEDIQGNGWVPLEILCTLRSATLNASKKQTALHRRLPQ